MFGNASANNEEGGGQNKTSMNLDVIYERVRVRKPE